MADYFRIPENINSFEQIHIPENITHLDFLNRNFTSFVDCPDYIITL
jgi:hypothetical protein